MEVESIYCVYPDRKELQKERKNKSTYFKKTEQKIYLFHVNN